MRLKLLSALLALAGITPVASAQDTGVQAPSVQELSCPAGQPIPPTGAESRYPPVLSRSPLDYPAALKRAAIEGGCTAMFDLDPTGQPIDIEIRCNVSEEGKPVTGMNGARPQETVAKDRFILAAQNLIACSRYASEQDPASRGKWRSNIKTSIYFYLNGYPGGPPEPEAFSRPAPAPPIPTEQIAYLAEVQKKLDEFYAEREKQRAALAPTPNPN